MNSSTLDTFTRAAQNAANQVIAAYSTSFGAATRLLGPRHRQHIRNIYALVRVADELVDGVGQEAGLGKAAQEAALDRFITETHLGLAHGFSTDLVIHAFAQTAREAKIGSDLIDPFFDSMRTDLALSFQSGTASFDSDAHDAYVHGSAEVVGLMCLKVFIRAGSVSPEDLRQLEHGASRLGTAFQDVNFLRDVADDTFRLDRSYLSAGGQLTAADRDKYVARIRAQIADAEAVLPLLPRDARAAVRSAAALFAALADRISSTTIDDLYRSRIRIPDAVKACIIASALVRTWREHSS